MPGLTNQARSAVLMFWNNYKKAMEIRDDIMLTKPTNWRALRTDWTYRTLNRVLSVWERGLNPSLSLLSPFRLIDCEINAHMCDIAKAGKDSYEFLKNYAKKVGVPVPAEASTTEAPTVDASCSEDSTTESSTTEGK